MRSRYSAYALEDLDYLRATWHPDFTPRELIADKRIRWIGLDIRSGERQGQTARVEFEARYLADGRVDAVHENSDFVRERGRWFYTRGKMMKPSFEPWKPGRNENCPCASGKKFKRCCAGPA